ncbi:MAG: TlpA family protein disulfide reductase [Bacteroidia bacterium]|nr:TlpA family protein disulfide reductase [Bacteroidia bacterium]
MIKNFLLIIILLASFSFGMGQDVRHFPTFAEFEPMLEASQGDTLLVFNFWATWCRPCVKELPYFAKADSAFKSQKVKVILVSIDDPKLIDTRVKPFIERRKITQEVVVMTDHKQNDWIPKVDESWSGAIPATLVVEPSKKLRAFKEQSFTYDELSKWIEELIAERDK